MPILHSPGVITPGQFGGCLGARYDPLVVNDDPNSANFRVPDMGLVQGITRERLDERRGLLTAFDRGASLPAASVRDHEVNRAKALKLMTSGDAGRAFDLSKEPAKVRERYGRHSWGQSHLLARERRL